MLHVPGDVYTLSVTTCDMHGPGSSCEAIAIIDCIGFKYLLSVSLFITLPYMGHVSSHPFKKSLLVGKKVAV